MYFQPLVTVASCAATFLFTRNGYPSLQSDREGPVPSQWQHCSQATSRRSSNVATAAAVSSTVLLTTRQAAESSFSSLGIRTTIFLLFRTILYIALAGRIYYLPNRKMLEHPTELFEGLSLSSMVLWTMVLMVFGLLMCAIDCRPPVLFSRGHCTSLPLCRL